MIMVRKKAQSTLEYLIFLIIIMGAFAATSNYIKRGLQGKWKAAVDDLGDQYDPRATNSLTNYTLTGESSTTIKTFNAVGGIWTQRTDLSNSVEQRTGTSVVGGY